jgi:hypothetical protein
MKLNLLKSEKRVFLGVLREIASELRGIRVSLDLLTVKYQAAPLPDQPDDSDFLAQDDAEFARLEQIARESPTLPEEELSEQEAEPPPRPPRRPPGSFLPRFPPP